MIAGPTLAFLIQNPWEGGLRIFAFHHPPPHFRELQQPAPPQGRSQSGLTLSLRQLGLLAGSWHGTSASLQISLKAIPHTGPTRGRGKDLKEGISLIRTLKDIHGREQLTPHLSTMATPSSFPKLSFYPWTSCGHKREKNDTLKGHSGSFQ